MHIKSTLLYEVYVYAIFYYFCFIYHFHLGLLHRLFLTQMHLEKERGYQLTHSSFSNRCL